MDSLFKKKIILSLNSIYKKRGSYGNNEFANERGF